MIEILQKVCDFAYEQNKEKSSKFWNNFYDNESGESIMGDLLEKWNSFSSALNNGEYKNLNGIFTK